MKFVCDALMSRSNWSKEDLVEVKHFAFVSRGQLAEGDSGSLVFVDVGGEKYAIGLLQGQRLTSPNYPDRIYEAIILCHALKDVESEYPHLVGPFTHYSTRGLGARPPCSN